MPFNSLRWSAARHSPRYFSNSTERRGQGRGRTVIPGFAVRYIAIMLPSQTRHLMCQSQTVVLFSLFFIYMLWRAERHSEKKYIKVTGFEPMALCTQNRCADQTALHLVSLPEAYRSTRSMNTNWKRPRMSRYPLRESNPCLRHEKTMSEPLDERDKKKKSHSSYTSAPRIEVNLFFLYEIQDSVCVPWTQ